MNLTNDTNLTELPAPKIFIPYPQTLDPQEFLPRSNSRKPCNGFMIYRKVYQKQLNANSYRFKMTVISRWASALWSKENEKLKDAYRQFASKIAKLHSEIELEALNNRINTIRLLAAPYVLTRQFISPPSTPLTSDSISSILPQNYYYMNQSLPYMNLYLDNQQQFCTFPNNFCDDQQYVNPFENHFNNNNENIIYNDQTFQTLPSSIEQPLEDNNSSFFL
ncbi:hypothetical protein C1645_782342 [Glomus cerebriforme]|uniref:HMG box domain-containing protein n=1 Tax=Glomus cerebriforme TaxID=658196 RepID=A0A397SDK1_9GLOM|nr:hypothetical protein C1645_791809 [Glomus cerebriforme]RIA85213.1 hypothetical protein C1645_782342 [Glomus cerebriforme]